MAFVMRHSIGAFTKWILLMCENRKSEAKQATKLKQCIVHGKMHGIIPHFKLLDTA